MDLYKIVKEKLIKNKELREQGGYIGVPQKFSRLADYIPLTCERGKSIGILGATGAGKSRYTRDVYLYHPYKFYKETGYPLKIILFGLEDSKEKIMSNIICHYIHEKYGYYITLQELNSSGKRVLPDEVIEKLEEATEFFKDFEKIVTIVDAKNEPTALYKFCEDYAMRTGEVKTYEIEVSGKKVKQTRYVPHNNVHTIIIVDNISNVEQEEGQVDERRSIIHLCRDLIRGRLCNFFGFTVVQVLQQDFASERQQFSKDGQTIVAKLEPSLASIGDSKTIARSMHEIYGIFHPARFGLISYPMPNKYVKEYYRLDILENRFRSISVLKANDTDFGMKLPIYFDAVSETMTELPQLGTEELTQLYKKIMDKNPEKFTKMLTLKHDEDEIEESPF